MVPPTSEKSPPPSSGMNRPEHSQPRKRIKALWREVRSKFAYTKEKLRLRQQEPEDFEAIQLAGEALLLFLAGKVQKPKQSIFPNDLQPDISFSELLSGRVEIFRTTFHDLHVNESFPFYEWFVGVKQPKAMYFFPLSGSFSSTLSANEIRYLYPSLILGGDSKAQSYPINDISSVIMDITPQPVRFKTEVIDVMFSGSPARKPGTRSISEHGGLVRNPG